MKRQGRGAETPSPACAVQGRILGKGLVMCFIPFLLVAIVVFVIIRVW